MPVDGKYRIEVTTPIGKQEATITLKMVRDELKGRMETPVGNSSFIGSVNGNSVAWSVEVITPVGRRDLFYRGAVNGDEFNGEMIAAGLGTSPFKGKRL